MTINHAVLLPVILVLALSGCDGAVPRTDERQPSHPAPAPLPPRAPPRAPPVVPERSPEPRLPPVAATDWRDVPLPPGDWTWSMREAGSIARFGPAGQAPAAMMVCDRGNGVVRIAITSATASGTAIPATITTSTSSGNSLAEPQMIDGLRTLAIALPASSRLLDAMAFSRGRFRIAVGAAPPVVLPSWSEVGRVVEDCRG